MGCPLTDKKASVLPKQPLQFRTLHITKNFVFAKVTDSLLISKYFYLFSTLFPVNGLYVRETRLTSIEHDERGPVERVVEIRAVHEVVSGEVQGLMLGFSGNEVRVKAHHEFGSGGIIDTPESHENGLDTGFLERGLESDDAVLRYGSGGCVAGGKHHHGTVAHIELRYLGTIEQTGSGIGRGA